MPRQEEPSPLATALLDGTAGLAVSLAMLMPLLVLAGRRVPDPDEVRGVMLWLLPAGLAHILLAEGDLRTRASGSSPLSMVHRLRLPWLLVGGLLLVPLLLWGPQAPVAGAILMLAVTLAVGVLGLLLTALALLVGAFLSHRGPVVAMMLAVAVFGVASAAVTAAPPGSLPSTLRVVAPMLLLVGLSYHAARVGDRDLRRFEELEVKLGRQAREQRHDRQRELRDLRDAFHRDEPPEPGPGEPIAKSGDEEAGPPEPPPPVVS